MLALGYLALVALVGDLLSRPLYGRPGVAGADAVERPRRLATAFLVGLLSMTWLTYLAALVAAAMPDPLQAGQMVTVLVGLGLVVGRLAWQHRRAALRLPPWLTARPDRAELLDWVLIGVLTVFASWMATATYQFRDGELRMATFVWSDFGPTSAIAQSFAFGRNFPTEYPHFAGPPILYHFLFYFQVGNLTSLGFDPALATNLLSVASLVAMLVLVMALGRALFGSAAVGRIAAILFFFHGSLAFLPYLASFATPSEALAAIGDRTAFLASGFPYRGEEWGIWTQAAFLNQRHLASAIGILVLGVLFVVERAAERDRSHAARVDASRAGDASTAAVGATAVDAGPRAKGTVPSSVAGYVLVGLLLGLLPWWNSALFVASAIVFAVLFPTLPNRLPMVATGVVAGLTALPQILALRPADLPRTAEYPLIHVGYVVENPTVLAVTAYLAVTFGPKLLLAGVAAATGTPRRWAVLLAFSSLAAAAFTIQFSAEVFANHKFLNVWLVVLNVFAAAGLVLLWEAGVAGPAQHAGRALRRGLAIAFVAIIATGGLIDLVPIRNAQFVSYRLDGDPLYEWVRHETDPGDVFLTDLHVTDAFLLAGRKLYHGWPYYAWSAGYPVREREELYRRMLGGTDPVEVMRLLRQEQIAYVAVDDGMRTRGMVPTLNEPLLAQHLERVFEDAAGRYGHLVIYRVPRASG